MRIGNGYAGIGGNRGAWGDEHEIVAIENNPKIAAVYQARFPNDTVIVGDAHEYMREHLHEFDFWWMSPVCKTHSRIRHHLGVKLRGQELKYPDMQLYEEILLLQHHFAGGYVVENVIPYYEPLIPAQQINRHLYWANFTIPPFEKSHENLRAAQIPQLQALHGVDLSGYDLPNKREVLRNMVPAGVGKHILDAYLGTISGELSGGLLDLLEEAPA